MNMIDFELKSSMVWWLPTMLTRACVEKILIRHFCVPIFGNVKDEDLVVLMDVDRMPIAIGRLTKTKYVGKNCRQCIMGLGGAKCKLWSLNGVYFVEEGEHQDVDGDAFCVQSVEHELAEKLKKWFMEEECDRPFKHDESRWHMMGENEEWTAIFQCPGFTELKNDRPLQDVTGENFRSLCRQLKQKSVSVFNASPIPHPSQWKLCACEINKFSDQLKERIKNFRNVLCCGKVAIKAYEKMAGKDGLVGENKKVIAICHLGHYGMSHVRGDNNEEKIKRISRYVLRCKCDGAYGWDKFAEACLRVK